jgi:hypothetical protein
MLEGEPFLPQHLFLFAAFTTEVVFKFALCKKNTPQSLPRPSSIVELDDAAEK